MTFLSPIWLLLGLPLFATLWLWAMPSRLLTWMRGFGLALLILALAGLAVRLPSRAGVVVAVMDRSRSMPSDFEAKQLEQIQLMQGGMGAEDRIAVVSFGEQPATEHAPQPGGFGKFSYELGRDASNLHDAIERALALIEPDAPGRIVVVSDGRWTGKDPMSAAARAAARGIPVDFRMTSRETTSDLAIESLDAPSSVAPREGFMLTAWVHAPEAQSVRYELKRHGRTLASGSRDVPSGLSRLTFRDAVQDPSTAAYTLTVKGGNENDAVPENNTARALVGVEGTKPVLLVTEKETSNFARLLEGGGLDIVARPPDELTWSLADLSNYSAVVVEEVPAVRIGTAGLENIAAWVPQTGSGLMLTGGKTSFGPGGYFKSPIDPIMPVSMELRREHRKLSIAIVVVLDRSGSMAMTVPGGRQKMDLANLGSSRVVELLSAYDEFGAFAVDSLAHEVVPLQKVEDVNGIKSKLMTIDSGNGGIFVYEGLSHAAQMISKSEAQARHIILFSDAADSEEPGDYVNLLATLQSAGVTVSVIGLGRDTDADANLLRDIARRGGPAGQEGRIFFTDDAENLPMLFAQDTFAVARSTFVEEPTPHKTLPAVVSLTGRGFDNPPPLGGYNLTYIKPTADQSAVTQDEYTAPVVASWQAGAGRVLAYTGQVDGEFTGDIASWDQIGDYLSGLVRWTAGDPGKLPDGAVLTQNVTEGIVTIELHLDPGRETRSLPSVPNVSILRGNPGAAPSADQAQMGWTSPDTLGISFPLRGTETAIASVRLAGQPPIAMPPVTLPYSPEFKPQAEGRGESSLRRIAKATGGSDRLDLAGIWDSLSRRPRMIDLAPWLLIAAIILLLMEVFERRTGVLSTGLALPKPRLTRREAIPSEGVEERTPQRAPVPLGTLPTREKPTAPDRPTPVQPEPEPVAQPTAPGIRPEVQPTVLDALADARRRAGQRTQKKL